LELGNVVIVAMTGYGHHADRQRFRAGGIPSSFGQTSKFSKVKEILATVSTDGK